MEGLTDGKGRRFLSYTHFCLARPPHGLGRDAAEIERVIAEGKKKARDLAAEP